MAERRETHLSWGDVYERARGVARSIWSSGFSARSSVSVYPIPRGGIPAAQAVCGAMDGLPSVLRARLVDSPEEADVLVDDVVDSGVTRDCYREKWKLPFFALVDKQEEGLDWVVFPWERHTGDHGPQENLRRLIQFVGDDPDREGLRGTPDRVVRSWGELYSGYSSSPSEVMKVFEEDSCDEMVALRDIDFFSMCEHHLLPFFGRAHIAYIPAGRVIGASKLIRLLEVFARRLQIQERLTEQVTGALMEYLRPRGAACVLEAQHLCMVARGVQKQHSVMVTSSLKGAFLEQGNAARQEFLSMIHRGKE